MADNPQQPGVPGMESDGASESPTVSLDTAESASASPSPLTRDDDKLIPGGQKPDPSGAINGSETPIVGDEDEAGRVFVSGDGASFSYGVLENSGINADSARWIIVRDSSTPLELEELKKPRSREPPSWSGRNYQWYEFELDTNPASPNYFETNMFVVLDESSDLAGFSLGAFTVVRNAADTDRNRIRLQNELQQDDLEPGFTREDSPWYIDGDGITKSVTGELWDPDRDDTPSTPTKDPGSSTTDVGTSETGGLSDGAKAGIGAGVGVVGLILIGLAIFFFLRRRRRRAARSADDTSLTPANDFIRDKESHSAQIAESPQSPASEDDRTRDSAFTGGDAAAAERAPASPVPTTGTGSGQRDVPSAMAHLVEEGMTEAEIRRLEEEERALDQAIEQAGRR